MPERSTVRVGLAGLLALAATYGLGRQAYGLFVPVFRAEFGLGREEIGYLAGAAQVGYLAATVATGVIEARFRPRLPVVAGCVLLAVGPVLGRRRRACPGGSPATGAGAGERWLPARTADRRPAGRRHGGLVAPRVGSLRLRRAGRGPRGAPVVRRGGTGVDDVGAPTSPARPRRRRRPVYLRGSVPPCGAPSASAGRRSARSAARSRTASTWAGRSPSPGWDWPPPSRSRRRWWGRAPMRWVPPRRSARRSPPASPYIAMWSQEAFPDRPTTGFTATIVCIAAGFAVGPVLYVVLRADLAGVGAGVPTIDVRPFAGGDLLLGEVDDGHGCIPVLHAGGRDHHGDQQTDGVGDQASSIWRRGHCGGRPVRPGGSKMCSAAAHSASVNPHG